MVLRSEAVKERLLRLEEVIARLEALVPRSSELSRDFRDAWAAERGLQLAAEIAFDVGNHILSAHYGTSASDYQDIIERLAAHGVIDAELRERFGRLGGFRNLLVHGYLRVDPTRVAEALVRAPADFSAFARAIRAWLDRTLR